MEQRTDVPGIRADLIAEQEALDAVVADLSSEQWATPMPSPRWRVADQIAHLTYFDGTAALAVRDPDAFTASLGELVTLHRPRRSASRWTRPAAARGAFGPDDADESVTGPALDFCLVVTQRRHIDATSLVIAGDSARDWMGKAQAFAGPPTDGPLAR